MDKNCRLKVELSKNKSSEAIYKFILNENGEDIGWCHTKVNKDHIIEMNYEIYARYREMGYGIEGIESTINMLKNSNHNMIIFAKVNEKNIGAWRILERTGFRLKRVVFDKDEGVMVRIYIYDIQVY